MKQFVVAATSQASVRLQLAQKYNDGHLYTSNDVARIMSELFQDDRFLDDNNWQPERLERLASDIASGMDQNSLKNYKTKTYVKGEDLQKHIILILQTGSAKLKEKISNGLDLFYAEVESACQTPDRLKKYPKELSSGIRNVGVALISAFIKELGFTKFFKMDVHIKKRFPTLLPPRLQKPTESQLFSLFHEVASRIGETPFHLDKAIYLHSYLNGKGKRKPGRCCH
jgi:hypothetical protein